MKKLILMLSYLLILGCGVKGDPLPPEVPAELGRGRPNYRRATEGIKLENPEILEETESEDEDPEDEISPEEEF